MKSFKRHLRRVAGNELLTFENLNTLIIEIESVLNSRPLTPISSDPNDLLVLTPGHFLIGDALRSFRERDFRDTSSNRLATRSKGQTTFLAPLASRVPERAEHPKQMEQGQSRYTRRHHRHSQSRQRSSNAMAIRQNHQGPTRRRRQHTDGYRSNGNEHPGSEHQADGTTTEQNDSR